MAIWPVSGKYGQLDDAFCVDSDQKYIVSWGESILLNSRFNHNTAICYIHNYLYICYKAWSRSTWLNSFSTGDDLSRLLQITVYPALTAPHDKSDQGILYLPMRDPRSNMFYHNTATCYIQNYLYICYKPWSWRLHD